MSYLSGILNALSQLTNAAIGGHPNESISGRSYREPWPRAMKIINAVFFWQAHHCRGAYEKDVAWAKDYLNNKKENHGTADLP